MRTDRCTGCLLGSLWEESFGSGCECHHGWTFTVRTALPNLLLADLWVLVEPHSGHRIHGQLRPRLALAAVLAAWLAAEAVRRFGTVAVGHCISVVRRAAVGAHADRLLGGDRQHNPASHDAGRPDPRCCACNGPHFHWPACTMAHPALVQLHWPNVRLDLSTGRRRWARSSRQRTRKT